MFHRKAKVSIWSKQIWSFRVRSGQICLACRVDIFQSVFVAEKFLWHIGFSQNACKLLPTNRCGYSRSFSYEIVDQIDKVSFINDVLLQKELRSVVPRHILYLSSNSLLNPHQSGFTETLLVSLYNKLVAAVSHQRVSCLCLLDISAAF